MYWEHIHEGEACSAFKHQVKNNLVILFMA